MEFGLLGVAVASLAAAWLVLRATAAGELFDAVLTATVAGMLAGRVGAMILAGTNPVTRPLDILIVRGGVDTVVASTAALVFFMWASRRELWAAADAAAPAVAAALSVWHAGCFVGGSCLGTPSTLPWAWAASAGGVTRHPTEVYATLGLALVAGALVILVRRRQIAPGVVAAGALLGISGIRLVTEPLRVTIGGGPWWWYAAGVLTGGALIVWRTLIVRRAMAAAPTGDGTSSPV
ncbi:MAG TPA: prolipoprotein diacylglyceryl transferase family protein [Acidimicrobiia bacterium]|nr:prolipoprotein diacylglyceryl transferase family protein [Acidimicrobiia bacterium]